MKIDLRKELKTFYSPSARRVDLIDVPEFNFAMIDGRIEPGKSPETSESFQDALNALYGISFTLKFTSKLRQDNPIDYQVMPLEGLWWTEEMAERINFDFDVDLNNKDNWQWTLMILQPAHITQAMFAEALEQLRKKRDHPVLAKLRLESFHEGLCIQIMHIGTYDLEPMTIARMKGFARENGYRLTGNHHEIYMSDPRRVKPESLRTILRYPVEKAAVREAA